MSRAPANNPLVLLVEDNETIRDAFGILLVDSGYRVAEAATGAAALKLAAEESPAIILMDLGLPDVHGLEVTRRLKASPGTSAIPVVALTGRALETDAAACEEAGCAAFLAKPVDSARLLEVLARVLTDGRAD